MGDSRNYLMVVALDFGTTYSGFAFSTRYEYKTDPTTIHTNPVWRSGSRSLMSLKTPTCLLLNEDGKFEAFGYDAENLYTEAISYREQDQYYYFQRFKMNLHNNKNITSGMVLEDIIGKTLPAFEVFNLSIKALVDHFIECLGKQGKDIIEEHEIQWVLTVPAIWTDAAKQFMRSSAEKAGIKPDKLILAFEPETASIWCHYMPTEKLKGSEPGFTMTTEGTEYMVVDLGGLTADITVYQTVANGQLKEKYKATGHDCGGNSVDKRFFRLLEEIVGQQLMDSLQKEDPLCYLDLFREWEVFKRGIGTKRKGKFNFYIPLCALDNQCKTFHDNKTFAQVLASSRYSYEIGLRGDKLRVEADLMRSLFKPTVDSIIRLMKDILNSKMTKGEKRILMVGGFAECQIVQDAVQKSFSDERIIIPEDAGLSVLKGAVLYGHLLSNVKSPVIRNSYGIKTHIKFNPRKFDEKNKVRIDGIDYCDNIFSKIVDKDENIEAGTVVRRSYITLKRNQENMEFKVYVSEFHHPSFVNEIGCSELCKPTITFDDICAERRWVDVEFIIGNTEIRLKAVDRNSGKEITAEFNLI